MSDRIKAFTVVLDEDYRDDDARVIADAVRMIRGVAHVTPHVATYDDYMARARVATSVATALHKAIEEIIDPRKPL